MSILPNSLIEVAFVKGKSRLVSSRSIQPLKILNPDCETAVHAVIASFGGGMVAGDKIHLNINAGPHSKLLLTTQSNSRVFKSESGKVAEQAIVGVLEENAFVVNFPDPLIPHENSIIRQEQNWDLKAGAVLLSIDWFASGRSETGEQFKFSEYNSVFRIDKEGMSFFNDSFSFGSGKSNPRSKAIFANYNHFLNGYLAGDESVQGYQSVTAFLLGLNPQPESARDNFALGQGDFIFAADLVKPGLLAFRVLGRRRLDLDGFLRAFSKLLSQPGLLGFDVFERRF